MKSRPILFSDQMVRALIAGTKTQTRRIVKGLRPGLGVVTKCQDGSNASLPGVCWDIGGPIIHCPHGQPGDQLWVREAWAQTNVLGMPSPMTVYRAYDTATDYGGPWKPSIHMHRWRSRITLEITGVRAERLWEISDEDAEAEGAGFEYSEIIQCSGSYRGGYANLWESINGPGSWAANPWVWVIEFKRVEA